MNCLKTCSMNWGEVNSVYTDYIVFLTSEEMIQAEVRVEDKANCRHLQLWKDFGILLLIFVLVRYIAFSYDPVNMLLMDGCFGKWGTNQNDGSALGIGDETPLSIPFGTTLCSSDGKETTSIRKFYFVGTGDTRECLDISFTVIGGSILRSTQIAVMETELCLVSSLSKSPKVVSDI
ncbi:hypothetical protein Tco_0734952 [Tanacetum coccineum]